MFFNFTNKNQFTMRLQLKWGNIEVVKEMKILGTIIDDSLSWDSNCSQLIKKVNNRMKLLRSVHSFGASNEEMVHLWILFCRSLLEQSCVLWHKFAKTGIKHQKLDDLFPENPKQHKMETRNTSL